MNGNGYRIETDPAHGRLRIEVAKGWGDDTPRRFALDLDVAMRAMALGGSRAGQYLVLFDLSAHDLLSPALIASFEWFAAGPGLVARRVAVLVQGTFQPMQLRRIAGAFQRYRFFLLESEAETWLEEAATELA